MFYSEPCAKGSESQIAEVNNANGHVASARKRTRQCLILTSNNTKTIGRMTCHCFLRPIKRDLTSSFYTAHANACFVHCLSAFICSSHFAGTAFKSSRASTYHVYVKRRGHMIQPCGRRNQSSKISKYDRSPNSGPVNTPIIWTAANSQAKIYYKTQLLESRLALNHGQILTQVLVL